MHCLVLPLKRKRRKRKTQKQQQQEEEKWKKKEEKEWKAAEEERQRKRKTKAGAQAERTEPSAMKRLQQLPPLQRKGTLTRRRTSLCSSPHWAATAPIDRQKTMMNWKDPDPDSTSTRKTASLKIFKPVEQQLGVKPNVQALQSQPVLLVQPPLHKIDEAKQEGVTRLKKRKWNCWLF